jgi:hypothetical protein
MLDAARSYKRSAPKALRLDNSWFGKLSSLLLVEGVAPSWMSFALSNRCEQRGQVMVRIIRAAMGCGAIPAGFPILMSERMAIIKPAFAWPVELAARISGQPPGSKPAVPEEEREEEQGHGHCGREIAACFESVHQTLQCPDHHLE